MKRRRTFLVGLAGMFSAPPITFAQQPRKIARIGWLSSPAVASAYGQAFLEGLRALGHVEGKTFVVDYRLGDIDSIPTRANELVRLNPDCILAAGFDGVRTLMQLTKTIPIVIGNMDADPVKEGIIASLARPGGNVTGLVGIQWELAGKRLELLCEIAPKASRVAVLFDRGTGVASAAHVEGTEAAAHKLGIQLQLLEARDPEGIDRAFESARAARADAISVIHNGAMQTHRPRIIRLALEARLPAIYSAVNFASDGGLVAYAPDTADQFRRAAVFVDKILKGAKPADLPVEQPTKFELVVNMKTAKSLGITIPPTILVRATRVIE